MTFKDEAAAVDAWDVAASKQVDDFRGVAKKWRFDAKVRAHTHATATATRLKTTLAGLDAAAEQQIVALDKEYATKVTQLRQTRDRRIQTLRAAETELSTLEDTHPTIVLQVRAKVPADRAAIGAELAALPTTTVSALLH
jgi:hypothetical protein